MSAAPLPGREPRGANKRVGRIAALVAHEAAIFIREAAGTESLITVTRAEAAPKGERITVFVSVFPEAKEASALAFLARQREAFSAHLKTHARLAPLPRVDFAPDEGEKVRRRLDALGSA